MKISCGVPQGSILGPALFILYVNDMCNVSSIVKSILFADDTNLFLVGDDLKEVCETMSFELDKLSRWFQAKKLSLNVSKTNFMIFSNKKCNDNHMISINGMDITRVFVTKFLGVHLDFQFNWSKHISVITNKIAKNVSVMYRVRHLLTNTTLYNLYCTLILPYLNYCCEAWGNTYKSRIQPLYIIQKKAIRICGNVDYRSHTRPLFYHWKTLGLYDIVHFNSMVFMFKVYAKLLPTNLLSFFKKVNDSHNYNTRNNNNNFKIRFTRTTQKAGTICVKGPKLWNVLNIDVKSCKTTVQFKKKYKAVLLQAYKT